MPSPPTPDEQVTDDTVKAVNRGDVDLARLTKAMQQVMKAGKAAVTWQVDLTAIEAFTTWADDTGAAVRPGDLTLGQQIQILDKSGLPWHLFDPTETQANAAVLLAVLLESLSDMDYDKAHRVVCDTVTTDEFDDAIDLVDQRPADPT